MKDLPVKDLCVLYSGLLSASHDAFEQGLFKVSYYSLNGAMQCALELKDSDRMVEVGELAQHQLLELKAHFPDSTFDKQPTELTLYQSLVRVVDARGFLLHYKSEQLN